MFVQKLSTANPQLQLVEPNLERDALLSMQWVADPHGRETLRLMGLPNEYNRPYSLAEEQQRIGDFLTRQDQVNWMIEYDGRVVGAVWIDREPFVDRLVEAPMISIMVGDPASRGKGIGPAVFAAVLQWWETCASEPELHARHLLDNQRSAAMLAKAGFVNNGQPYHDANNLAWQNMIYKRS